MYNPSEIDNIDYILILSEPCYPSCCINGRISVTSTVNRHIPSTVIYVRLLTSSVITIRTMSVIVYLSNTLQRLLVAVRTSIYNYTARILPIVSMVLWHLPSEVMCSKLSVYFGINLIDS